ncbi:MAG: FecR family protein [Bacteroidales bacterium]|nr:FecR family protein [Bacteroidales bacterium]
MNLSESRKLLIIEYFQNTISSDDVKELMEWVNATEENLDYFSKMRLSWLLCHKYGLKSQSDKEKAWKKINKELRNEKKIFFISGKTRSGFRYFLRIAALWMVIFLAGSSLTYLVTRPHKSLDIQSMSPTRIFAPLGSRSNVILPDGSSVWLNAGSCLEYNSGFNGESRKVKLSGEGFFDVITNKLKPFIVSTGDISIIAHGTSFNVKAYPEEKTIVTTLIKGEVTIEGKDFEEKPFSLTMLPNQNVTYFTDNKLHLLNSSDLRLSEKEEEKRKDNVPVVSTTPVHLDEDVKTELYTSWKDDRWIIEGEKFKDLIVMLERRYDISVILTSNKIEELRFSGTIENETIEQVFHIISLTIPIRYSIDVGKVYVDIDYDLLEKYKSAYN